jgi:hypothetical protein
MVPKPRREGQSGGMNHRSSYKGFRGSGGNVKPPSKGCLVIVLAGVSTVALAAYGVSQAFL